MPQQSSQQQAPQLQPPRAGPAPGAINVDYQPQNPNQIPLQFQYPYGGMSGQNFSQPGGFQMTIRRPSSSSGPRPDVQPTPFQPPSNSNNMGSGSGSASSSPVNRFGFGAPPYGSSGVEPSPHMGNMPLMPLPSEPRMGHYSNYQAPYPAYDQWQQPSQPPPQMEQQSRVPSSRRSTISNPSDHERTSRPSTSDAKSKAREAVVKIEPTPQEDDEDEADEKMDHRKRKRNRTIRSCVPCHNHKRKVRPPCCSVRCRD